MSRPRRALARLAPLAALAVTSAVAALTGCARAARPPATPASLLADAPAANAAHRAFVDSMVERLARRAVRRGDRTLDVLLLSGGGQNGAYGAGFLRAWARRPDAPAPTFDLVTGVSTGALQAPLALVGTPAALDTLGVLYRTAVDRLAPQVDWLFWLRRTGGVVRTGRYRAGIASIVDDAFATQLAAAFADDRQLAVATTDLDLGIGRAWDLATLLPTAATPPAERPARLEAARRVLYASTAIPGAFPPIVLDGHVHADGGSVSNVLPALDLAAYRALAARLRARGVLPADSAAAAGAPVTVRLWVLMNLWTHPGPEPVAASQRKAVGRRGNGIMFFSAQPQLLDRLQLLGRTVSREVPGLRVEVRHTQIPAEYALDPAATRLFDRAFMVRLDSAGAARGAGATPWDSIVSPYERPIPGVPGAPGRR